jgi:Fe-S-cluster containining protein
MTQPPLPPELRRMVKLTIQAHEAMDEAWEALKRVASATEQGREAVDSVACAAGCAACCSYMVDSVTSEAMLIASGVEASDPVYKEAVMERLLDWEYEFMHWRLKHPMPPREDGGHDLEHDLWRGAWQARRIACPFLDLGDNTCSIYADRPSTCRGHHACYPTQKAIDAKDGKVGVPPEGCFTKWEDVQSGQLTPIWMLNAEVNNTFSRMLHEVMDHYGLQHDVHLLPVMVLNIGRTVFGWPKPNPRKKRKTPPRITHARLVPINENPDNTESP